MNEGELWKRATLSVGAPVEERGEGGSFTRTFER